MSVYVQTVR